MTPARANGQRRRWVVKVGGALAKAGALDWALAMISGLCAEGYKIVVSPGGGAYADFIRRHGEDNMIPDPVTHQQAILSAQQFGHELAWRLAGGEPVNSTHGAMRALADGLVPVFLPGQWLPPQAPQGWMSTSDTLAAATCHRLGFGGLALLKCVDGVLENGRLLSQATAGQAAQAGVVDPVLGKMIGQRWDVFVLNGMRPERLAALLQDGQAEGTRIIAD